MGSGGEERGGRVNGKDTVVGLYGIVAGWVLVTGSCTVSSAPLIPGNLGHFQPVHMELLPSPCLLSAQG